MSFRVSLSYNLPPVHLAAVAVALACSTTARAETQPAAQPSAAQPSAGAPSEDPAVSAHRATTTVEPEPHDQADSGTANEDAAFGPPSSLAQGAPPVDDSAPASEQPPGWYEERSEHSYVDVLGAYGWQNESYLLTVTPFNFYFGQPDQWLAAHLRVLGVGVLRYRQQQLQLGGATTPSDETTFTLSVFEPTFRAHFAGPVFFAAGFGLRLSFNDGLNAHVDAQPGGLGFAVGGWGLEGGVRLMQLPHHIVVINGNEFTYDKYSWQVFARVETNIALF